MLICVQRVSNTSFNSVVGNAQYSTFQFGLLPALANDTVIGIPPGGIIQLGVSAETGTISAFATTNTATIQFGMQHDTPATAIGSDTPSTVAFGMGAEQTFQSAVGTLSTVSFGMANAP